ncbi:MAG: cell wall hydrolase [Sphingobium sp.]|nr:cell wall hydrolase [Sphingobium sp.]
MATHFVTAAGPTPARRWIAIALVFGAVLILALTMSPLPRSKQGARAPAQTSVAPPPGVPIPVVEPLELDMSDPDAARAHNAEIPFSTAPNPAAPSYRYAGDATARDRATDCLAAAMLYEAGDDAKGEQAVGQVVLNRLRHPAFPKTVCGVVFQGEERATGCQFTFTCDGAMARIPSDAAWDRARKLAGKMLTGEVYKPIGMSTHYHTDWVIPYWSASLDKVAAVDTHLFFRWKGWWGTPPAFVRQVPIAAEPAIQKLALLSPAHRPALDPLAFPGLAGSLIDDSRPPLAVGPELIGKRVGPGKLVAVEPGGNGFIMTLDKGGDPTRYAEAAQRLCAGRAQCRLLAWTDTAAAPKGFPIAEASQPSMSFSYIRVKESGLERTLYNCSEFPATPRIKCMARRVIEPAAPKLLADQQAEKTKLRISDGPRPAADMNQGQLVPTTKPEAPKVRPLADMKPAGTPVAGAF